STPDHRRPARRSSDRVGGRHDGDPAAGGGAPAAGHRHPPLYI
ncbi:hypothetical protein A2U01_0111124, partial [Trifolium medium]|nr:hypothetical protein [Trifolium medium]